MYNLQKEFDSYMQFDNSEIRYSKKLVLFNRIYKNEKKFEKTNDNFDYKLLLFYDKYKRAGLFKRTYIYETLIILIEQTQSRIYKIRNMILIFDEFFDKFFVLIKNLHVFIVSHKIIQKFSNVYTQYENSCFKLFYIDRQYHWNGFNFCSGFNSRKNTFQFHKKCFVCNKKKCWSIKHIEHEWNEAKKRFNSCMFKYKNRSKYDHWLHQYIIEYENIKDIAENNENDDEFNQFFDDLALEAKFAENETTFAIKMISSDFINMFFTSFENF